MPKNTNSNEDIEFLKGKMVADAETFNLEQVEAGMRLLLARYYKLTGRKIISHMPEPEVTQAKKEYDRGVQPITVSDFRALKNRTGKSTADFCAMLGITRQRYYDIAKQRDSNEVLKEIPLSLLIRLYMKLPSLIPDAAPAPTAVHEAIGGAGKINFQAMAIVFGRGSASSRRWKKGTPPSEVSRPLLDALITSNRAEEIFDVMIDNVYEEAKVRGLSPFKDMGWNGVPVEGPVADLDREYLNLPTVDHRRIEAKTGQVIGWGATETGIKHIKKRVEKKAKS